MGMSPDPDRDYTFDEVMEYVTDVLKAAIVSAEAKHGPLTTNRVRALAILTAEVGEVAMAVLGTTGGSRPSTDDELSIELVQVAATAITMLISLLTYRMPAPTPKEKVN
jgi:NTP pyrophosphatase (non-canonical NTP hydrolase)